jgi:disulfide bond formation protein DsbB
MSAPTREEATLTALDSPADHASPSTANDETTTDVAVRHYGMYFVLLVAWTAMLGSLFFSEVLGWIPCTLCWYQRFLMYPIALLVAVALLARVRNIALYVLPLAILGIGVSTYHYVYQKTSWFDSVHVCLAGVSCKGDYLGRGLVTIPGLAFTAFVLITLAAIAVWRRGGVEPLADGRPWLPVLVTILGAVVTMLLLMLALPPARLSWLGG